MKLIEYIQANWGWFVTIGGVISAWITHTNWDKVLATIAWLQARGGIIKWLASLFWNSSAPVVQNVEADAAEMYEHHCSFKAGLTPEPSWQAFASDPANKAKVDAWRTVALAYGPLHPISGVSNAPGQKAPLPVAPVVQPVTDSISGTNAGENQK